MSVISFWPKFKQQEVKSNFTGRFFLARLDLKVELLAAGGGKVGEGEGHVEYIFFRMLRHSPPPP